MWTLDTTFQKRDTNIGTEHVNKHVLYILMDCYLPPVSLSCYLFPILFVSKGNDPFVKALIILRQWIGCCSPLMARCVSVFIACVHSRCHIFPLGVSIVNCMQVFVCMWGTYISVCQCAFMPVYRYPQQRLRYWIIIQTNTMLLWVWLLFDNWMSWVKV